ncbi:MAG TPA: transcriptional regulator NrdR [Candidatus Manganitrophaceae bacterium]|nr:transcriptional regulator NrdR [Candidatus Manganitrophaceae bacterium]
MQCPFCDHIEDKVVDSRLSKEGEVIRRRRECLNCQRRFTTYERVEEIFPMVIKKDGRREPFDRQKILSGLKKACEKRPVSVDLLESVVTRIEKKVQELGETEVESRAIGEEVMRQLHELDQVAYVRFASVYREFKDVNQFMSELKGLLGEAGVKEKAEGEVKAKRET